MYIPWAIPAMLDTILRPLGREVMVVGQYDPVTKRGGCVTIHVVKRHPLNTTPIRWLKPISFDRGLQSASESE